MPRGLTISRREAGGFTLIEMLVVVAIMAAVVAMAAPRLLPVIFYSTHEGAARHLAVFGRAAIAEASLSRQRLYVRIDLDERVYWVERIPDPPEEDPLHSEVANDSDLPEEDEDLEKLAQEELDRRAEQKGTDEGAEALEEQSTRMAEKSNLRARKALVAQAARIKHDERALPPSVREQLNPSPSARAQRQEMEPEPVVTPLLQRTRLPEEISFAWVNVGGVEHKRDVATIEISPTGLDVKAEIALENAAGKVFIVRWDPVSGSTDFREQREKRK